MKIPRLLAALALLIALPAPGRTAPAIDLETRVVLTIGALSVEGERSSAASTGTELELGSSDSAGADLVIPWGKGKATATVAFRARLASIADGGEAVIFCEATTRASGRPPAVASREIRLADEGSGLFEVYGEGDRRIVLTIRGDQVRRAVVRPHAAVGAPVRFLVAVERVDGERVVLLETNELHTFVGEPVEYSFRLGQREGLESLRLSLKPVSVSGDIMTIEAELGGALPSAEGTTLLHRTEHIVASRHATSRLTATTGTPPSGYQFQVTPDF